MIGTMVLVLMGCGSAVFAGSMAGTVGAGVGTVGVALAFGRFRCGNFIFHFFFFHCLTD